MNKYILEQFSLRQSITGVVYEAATYEDFDKGKTQRTKEKQRAKFNQYWANHQKEATERGIKLGNKIGNKLLKHKSTIGAATALGGLGLGGHLMYKGYRAATNGD